MLSKIYKKTPGLMAILCLGLFVELANFENTFYKFMLTYRPEWGAINHLFAIGLGVFFLLNIVEWGLKEKKELSWSFAGLASIISFFVYSRMELDWDFNNFTEVHFVVLILALVLPCVVAMTTHAIAAELKEQPTQTEVYQAPTPPPEKNDLMTFLQNATPEQLDKGISTMKTWKELKTEDEPQSQSLNGEKHEEGEKKSFGRF